MKFKHLMAVGVVLLCASAAHGWWSTGHAFLTPNAVQYLPEPLATYFDENLSLVNQYATNEPPGLHFIDIDWYPEFHDDGTFPRDLNVLYAKYGVSAVNNHGISPWKIATYRQTLTAQMAAAQSPADWIALGQTAGEMAHYIEDIHQPFHTSQNYNGQFTGNYGIHARYEGTMIEQHFADLAIAPDPEKCVYIPGTVDTVLNSIDKTWQYVTPILNADTAARIYPTYSTAYYDSLWAATGPFTHSQFQLATEMVASMWYSAWMDAGSPTPLHVPEPCAVVLMSVGVITCSLRRRRDRLAPSRA